MRKTMSPPDEQHSDNGKPIWVTKFGGSSLATPQLIRDAAAQIRSRVDAGRSLVTVVSAMGDSTDRLMALETELRRLGAGAQAGKDTLRIEPKPLHGTVIETYDDHRIAMAFALAGLRVPGIAIANPRCVEKTWPDYFEALERL